MVVIYFFFFIVSGILDIVYFLKITGLHVKRKVDYLFLGSTVIFGIFIEDEFFGYTSILISNFFLGFTLLFLFYSRKNIWLIIGTSILIFYIDITNDVLYTIFSNLRVNCLGGLICNTLMISLEIYIIFKYHSFLKLQFLNYTKKVFIFLLLYLYAVNSGISIIYSSNNIVPSVSRFFSEVLIAQSIFAIIIYYLLVKTQKNIWNKHQQEKLQEELFQQKEYAETLEKEEDSLRRFRHDYKNMLTAVNYSVKMGNYDEAIAELDRYSEKNLDENALLKYKDVNHVKDEYVKSLLIAKISKMANDGIKYNFECRKDIPSLSEDIERLDLIRILGIAIDNAIEENEKILVTSNKNDTDIQIMMNTSEDVKLEFEIRNKILTDDVSLAQMKKRGYTTKKDHDGVGLANIEQIKQKYPAMDISYSIEDGYFDFYMVIEEDENYDEDNYL